MTYFTQVDTRLKYFFKYVAYYRNAVIYVYFFLVN